MTRLNYAVSSKVSIISYRVYNWDPPIEQYTHASAVLLKTPETIIWSRSIEVKFIYNSIVQNEIIEFILRMTICLIDEDYYNMDLRSYVVFFSCFMAFFVGPVTLKFIIEPPSGIPSDAETR